MKQRKSTVHTDSKSLWNYTLSPGWKIEEVQVLKNALQKFGVGKWKSIQQSDCLPGKSIGQIYIQTQRMLGQQSLAEFVGLHLDLEKVWLTNSLKQSATRKNGCVINTGDNQKKEERKRKIEENREKFSISQEEITKIKLPRYPENCVASYFTVEDIDKDKFNTLEKLIHLQNLGIEIDKKMLVLQEETKEKEPSKKVKLQTVVEK